MLLLTIMLCVPNEQKWDVSLNNCEMIEEGLCTGCVGLAENDWIGKERCEIYRELKNIKGIDLCKGILGGKSI